MDEAAQRLALSLQDAQILIAPFDLEDVPELSQLLLGEVPLDDDDICTCKKCAPHWTPKDEDEEEEEGEEEEEEEEEEDDDCDELEERARCECEHCRGDDGDDPMNGEHDGPEAELNLDEGHPASAHDEDDPMTGDYDGPEEEDTCGCANCGGGGGEHPPLGGHGEAGPSSPFPGWAGLGLAHAFANPAPPSPPRSPSPLLPPRKPDWRQRRVQKRCDKADVVRVELDLADMPTRGAYMADGKIKRRKKSVVHIVKWSRERKHAVLILDRRRRLIALLAAPHKERDEHNALAIKVATRADIKTRATYEGKTNSRGGFGTRFIQLHRESQEEPRYNAYYLHHQEEMDRLLCGLRPISNIMEDIFKEWFRTHHNLYRWMLGQVRKRLGLESFFRYFACLAVNFSRRRGVSCAMHKDSRNFAFGLCAIMPFGDFDPNESARLILKELGLEIELGPGEFFYLPSALISHGNTKLVGRKMRGSLAWWCGGLLFDWADAVYRLKEGLRAVSTFDKKERAAHVKFLIRKGLAMFPVVDENRKISWPVLPTQ